MSSNWTSPSGDPADGSPERVPQDGPASYGQPQYGQQAPGPYPPPGSYPPPGPSGQVPQDSRPQYGAAPPYGSPTPYGPGGWPGMAAKPGVIPLRALSLGDIFEGSIGTIRGNPGATLGLSFVVSLIFTLPAIALILGLDQLDPGDSEALREAVSLGSQQGGAILQAVGGIALTGMLTVVLADAVLGRRLSIGGAWSKVKGRLLALIGLNLLVLLAVVVLVAAVVLLAVLGYLVVEWLGVLIGVVGGILAFLALVFGWVKVSFASACVVLERQSPVAALKRSWALTRGQWWRVFGITLLAHVLASVISSVVFIPFAIALSVSTFEDPDALPSVGFLVGTQLVQLVINTVVSPFIAGVVGLLYLDQRIRKEALDVTLMAASQSG
ncbi:hypothetical protein PZ938_15755 [Luteipulveratus sp. YIM 133132]|uniref:hypothetical protein n=1 Tax=Luteipulveratus flavus TaxID=3031728 RepID=UPI0023AE77FB|nr:hypothetical protein [Luteipulveratus sp. YIM 133132]MDE9367072.1 hypothetical protein [Luteipulveratus sp. YIM 133132]